MKRSKKIKSQRMAESNLIINIDPEWETRSASGETCSVCGDMSFGTAHELFYFISIPESAIPLSMVETKLLVCDSCKDCFE